MNIREHGSKMNKAILFVFLVCLLAHGNCANPDLVNTSNIGLPSEYPYDMYSGYLNASADGSKQFHYVLYPAQSTNASRMPLVLWLNGGPGCSRYFNFKIPLD